MTEQQATTVRRGSIVEYDGHTWEVAAVRHKVGGIAIAAPYFDLVRWPEDGPAKTELHISYRLVGLIP